MIDYWLENAAEKGKHILVDLGYVNCEDARNHADQLFSVGIGKKNMQLAANGRLLLRIPPARVAKIMAQFPQIKSADDAPGYCWCTHTWLTERSRKLKWAM